MLFRSGPANDLTEGDRGIGGGGSGAIVDSPSSFSSSTCLRTCPSPPSVCKSYSCTDSPLSSSEVTKASSNGSSVGAGAVNGTRADGRGEAVMTGSMAGDARLLECRAGGGGGGRERLLAVRGEAMWRESITEACATTNSI